MTDDDVESRSLQMRLPRACARTNNGKGHPTARTSAGRMSKHPLRTTSLRRPQPRPPWRRSRRCGDRRRRQRGRRLCVRHRRVGGTAPATGETACLLRRHSVEMFGERIGQRARCSPCSDRWRQRPGSHAQASYLHRLCSIPQPILSNSPSSLSLDCTACVSKHQPLPPLHRMPRASLFPMRYRYGQRRQSAARASSSCSVCPFPLPLVAVIP
jgi:hypothetical protein